jgi:PhnB protein
MKAIPEGMHTLTPHIVCRDAPAAMAFYTKAFGAVEAAKLMGPDGMMRIGDSNLMFAEEMPAWGSLSPQSLNNSPVYLHLYVADVDASIERAESAGATVTMPAADMFWGDRYGQVVDPFGHKWSLATHTRDVAPDEMREAMKAMAPCPEDGPK